jgi:two-component system response regulator HydG
LIGRSAALRRVRDQIERVARSPRTTVLLSGETGTGKELAARAIHATTALATPEDALGAANGEAPYVAVNCAALGEGLLEAELFGYEPGAFTGAAPRGRSGLLAAAGSGTLLLDEIGELAPGLQAKLLRVLQERSYRRVGGARDLAVEARIVAATHRDLEEEVAAGRFREDLFYRLNVMAIRLPPLRERREDLAPLARHLLARLGVELRRPRLELAPDALAAIERHPWRGNVRELANRLERAALLCEAPLLDARALDLRPEAEEPAASLDLRRAEREIVESALREAGGNKSRAARLLGVDRTTLHHKLRRYEVRDAAARRS